MGNLYRWYLTTDDSSYGNALSTPRRVRIVLVRGKRSACDVAMEWFRQTGVLCDLVWLRSAPENDDFPTTRPQCWEQWRRPADATGQATLARKEFIRVGEGVPIWDLPPEVETEPEIKEQERETTMGDLQLWYATTAEPGTAGHKHSIVFEAPADVSEKTVAASLLLSPGDHVWLHGPDPGGWYRWEQQESGVYHVDFKVKVEPVRQWCKEPDPEPETPSTAYNLGEIRACQEAIAKLRSDLKTLKREE